MMGSSSVLNRVCMNEELVSVLVPTYNRAELIAETIQSALL
jgi:hypothetical protein